MGFLSQGLKHEFETAMVNEPSVFEPLKFYCMLYGLVISVDQEKTVSQEIPDLGLHSLLTCFKKSSDK